MDTQKITDKIATLQRAIKTSPTQILTEKLKGKISELKQVLKDSNISTTKLATSLLGSQKKLAGYSKEEFNGALKRLSARDEYSFLKGMSKGKVKDDLKRFAKPVGWRFKGRNNIKKPNAKELAIGKKNGTVYYEDRRDRSDVVRPAKLKTGGSIDDRASKTANIKRYLSEFPNNATSWAQATDELPTLNRRIGDYIDDYKGDKFVSNGGELPNDTRTTPSKRNTNHKKAILKYLPKLNDKDFNEFYDDHKNWFDKKYAKGGGVGDNQLNVVFSRKDVFEKAKDFYENESAFYPADVNDEFRTFVFDIENGEADVTEYYLNEELEGTELDGYYFEIADKMAKGGGVGANEDVQAVEKLYMETFKKSNITPSEKEAIKNAVDYVNGLSETQLKMASNGAWLNHYGTFIHLASKHKLQKEMAKGGMVVTKIANIPNFKQKLDEGEITYRGLGMGKLYDDFYDIAGESGTRIKVDGKEYYITDTEFNTFSRGADGKMKIKFDAPQRKYKTGGEIPNNYAGKSAELVWNTWTQDQRWHFVTDHNLQDNATYGGTCKMNSLGLKNDKWGAPFGDRTSWDWISGLLKEHISEGQYAKGGNLGWATPKADYLSESDWQDLASVKEAVDEGDYQYAMKLASSLDTIVRDEIPLDVWVKMGGNLTKSGQESFDKGQYGLGGNPRVNTMPKEQYERINAEIENYEMKNGGGINTVIDKRMHASDVCKNHNCSLDDYNKAHKQYGLGGALIVTGLGIAGLMAYNNSKKQKPENEYKVKLYKKGTLQDTVIVPEYYVLKAKEDYSNLGYVVRVAKIKKMKTGGGVSKQVSFKEYAKHIGIKDDLIEPIYNIYMDRSISSSAQKIKISKIIGTDNQARLFKWFEYDGYLPSNIYNKGGGVGGFTKDSGGNYINSAGYELIDQFDGTYQVLDPEGMDIVGDYLSLEQGMDAIAEAMDFETQSMKTGGTTKWNTGSGIDVHSFLKGDIVNYENKQYKVASFDVLNDKTTLIYLNDLNNKPAQDFKGDYLKVNSSRIKKMSESNTAKTGWKHKTK